MKEKNEVLINIKDEGLGSVFASDLITPRELINALKDLIVEMDSMEEYYKEELDKKDEYYLENYNIKSPYELYGISERDFH